jgi:hypothetical protein
MSSPVGHDQTMTTEEERYKHIPLNIHIVGVVCCNIQGLKGFCKMWYTAFSNEFFCGLLILVCYVIL